MSSEGTVVPGELSLSYLSCKESWTNGPGRSDHNQVELVWTAFLVWTPIGSSFRNMFGLVYLYRESFLGNALGPECCFELSWITLVDKDVLFLVSRLEDGHF